MNRSDINPYEWIRGGATARRLAEVGISWPPKKGWLKQWKREWKATVGDRAPQVPQPSRSMEMVRIVFDGGTSCNIPRLGYGLGYGSYQINDEPVESVRFDVPMSNNVAEVATLTAAIVALSDRHPINALKGIHLEITGDSKIALHRCKGLPRPFKGKPPSSEFYGACAALRDAICRFGGFSTTWQPREKSVALFGH